MGPFEPPVGRPVDVSGPARDPPRACGGRRLVAPPRRCYHPRPLRQSSRVTLRRAPWGLFFGLVGPVAPPAVSVRTFPLELHSPRPAQLDRLGTMARSFPLEKTRNIG